MKKTLNIAHRGFSAIYPENTMLAFERAIAECCDGIETDVQLTKDGHAVLIHDETLDRTTDGHGLVKDYTLAELQQFDAGIKFGKQFKGLKIPTLEEFLKLCSDKSLFVNLELKNSIINYKDIENVTYNLVHKYNLEKNVIISSFNHYSIKKCKEINPDIPTGILYCSSLYEPYNYIKNVDADALHPEYHSLDKDIVENAHSNGIKINTYTVNDEEDMKKLIELNIDGIITNHPDLLNNILNNK